MNRRDWALVAMIGVLWFGVYNVALNAGEQHVDAGTAAMLIQLAPILIGVLAGLLLGEGFPRMLVIGGLVAFAGTLIIGVATRPGTIDIAGVLLVLLAAVVYAVAVVAPEGRPAPGSRAAGDLAGLPDRHGQLPAVPAGTDRRPVERTAGADLGVLYLGVVPTAAAFLSWAYALDPQRCRAAGRDHLRGAADRDPARLDLPWRGAGAAGRGGRRRLAGRCRHRPAAGEAPATARTVS